MKKSEQITFSNPPNHINKYLTHWTGRGKNDKEAFEILCKIIESHKLYFGLCNNGFPDKSKREIYATMICFTDTPIEQSLEHCQRYNYFGISFNKQKMIEKGANPVLYIVENRQDYQKYFTKIQHEILTKEYMKEGNIIPIEIRYNLSWFLSITQPYKTEKVESKGFAEYLEREWRIIRQLPYHAESKLLHSNFDINEIDCVYNNLKSPPSWDCYLSFETDTIENIIVTKRYEAKALKLIKDCGLKCSLQIVKKARVKSTNISIKK